MTIKKMNKRGFTLIELLVVIAIIGLLSSTVLASLNTARSKARDARRISDVKQMQLALELYYDENGTYPTYSWLRSYNSTWDSLETDLAPFINLPVDPINESIAAWGGGLSYAFYSNAYGGPGQWYMIIFTLENQNLALDLQDGVTTPNGTFFNYGGDDGYIITIGL